MKTEILHIDQLNFGDISDKIIRQIEKSETFTEANEQVRRFVTACNDPANDANMDDWEYIKGNFVVSSFTEDLQIRVASGINDDDFLVVNCR